MEGKELGIRQGGFRILGSILPYELDRSFRFYLGCCRNYFPMEIFGPFPDFTSSRRADNFVIDCS